MRRSMMQAPKKLKTKKAPGQKESNDQTCIQMNRIYVNVAEREQLDGFGAESGKFCERE